MQQLRADFRNRSDEAEMTEWPRSDGEVITRKANDGRNWEHRWKEEQEGIIKSEQEGSTVRRCTLTCTTTRTCCSWWGEATGAKMMLETGNGNRTQKM